MTVAKTSHKKKVLPDFSEYVPLEKESLVRKVAHFLDWCAKNRPKEFIPYNRIAFSVLDLKHMPRMKNSDVTLVQHTMSRARPILIEEYKRTMVSAPGVGARATVDDADIVQTELAKDVRKLERDAARTAQLFNLVDPNKLPNTEEFKPWKEWFLRQIEGKGLFKRITSTEWEKMVALPPAPELK